MPFFLFPVEIFTWHKFFTIFLHLLFLILRSSNTNVGTQHPSLPLFATLSRLSFSGVLCDGGPAMATLQRRGRWVPANCFWASTYGADGHLWPLLVPPMIPVNQVQSGGSIGACFLSFSRLPHGTVRPRSRYSFWSPLFMLNWERLNGNNWASLHGAAPHHSPAPYFFVPTNQMCIVPIH